ncbi:MAG: hypothetical protein Q8P12_04555, partial [bacterium]|nr:hypothetical protein [bacterium]
FVASDETVDRYGTIIDVAGWDLKAFKSNPLFLFGHEYRSPSSVIGRVIHVEKDAERKKLLADVLFIGKDINPVAEMVFQMYAHKPPFLNAVSVGFIPFKTEEITDDDQPSGKAEKGVLRKAKLRYLKQELLEISAVTVPANPAALVDKAVQCGIDPVVVMAAKSVLPEIGDIDERDALEERMHGWMCKNGICYPEDYTEPSSVPDGLELCERCGTEYVDKGQKVCGACAAGDGEVRAGAVLNAPNKSDLKQAQSLIQRVLDSAEPSKDGGEEGKEYRADDSAILIMGSLEEIRESLESIGRDVLAALDELLAPNRIIHSKDDEEEEDEHPAPADEGEGNSFDSLLKKFDGKKCGCDKKQEVPVPSA